APRDLHSFPTRRSSDLDMNLRIACGPRIGEQERKRKVLAAERGAATRCRAGDRAGLEEPVQLHIRPAAQLNVGNQPALLRDVNRSEEHTSELQSRFDLV